MAQSQNNMGAALGSIMRGMGGAIGQVMSKNLILSSTTISSTLWATN